MSASPVRAPTASPNMVAMMYLYAAVLEAMTMTNPSGAHSEISTTDNVPRPYSVNKTTVRTHNTEF